MFAIRCCDRITGPIQGTAATPQTIAYTSIRVDNPVTIKKGGIALGEDKLAKAVAKIATMAE